MQGIEVGGEARGSARLRSARSDFAQNPRRGLIHHRENGLGVVALEFVRVNEFAGRGLLHAQIKPELGADLEQRSAGKEFGMCVARDLLSFAFRQSAIGCGVALHDLADSLGGNNFQRFGLREVGGQQLRRTVSQLVERTVLSQVLDLDHRQCFVSARRRVKREEAPRPNPRGDHDQERAPGRQPFKRHGSPRLWPGRGGDWARLRASRRSHCDLRCGRNCGRPAGIGVTPQPLEVGTNLRRALGPHLAVFLERLEDDPLELRGQVGIRPRGWRRGPVQNLVEDDRRGFPDEGRAAGSHFVENRAKTEQVRPYIEGLAARLLGRHICDRAHRRAGRGEEFGLDRGRGSF